MSYPIHSTCSRRAALRRLAAIVGVVFVPEAARAQTGRHIASVTDDDIQALAALTGQGYVARRDAFLASAPPLPHYPFDPGQRDPRYRVQYLILTGWQRNAELLRQIADRPNAINAEFTSNSAAGFHPFWNRTRLLSAREWRYSGLAYAWEDITKFTRIKPGWQIHNGAEIIRGFPHADSIDPLLIAAQPEQDRSSRETWQSLLAEMPAAGLKERLALETDFHLSLRPMIQEALRRQQ